MPDSRALAENQGRAATLPCVLKSDLHLTNYDTRQLLFLARSGHLARSRVSTFSTAARQQCGRKVCNFLTSPMLTLSAAPSVWFTFF